MLAQARLTMPCISTSIIVFLTHFSGAPHVGHIPKLSLLAQAVQNNICSPCYYDNIRLFFGMCLHKLTIQC